MMGWRRFLGKKQADASETRYPQTKVFLSAGGRYLGPRADLISSIYGEKSVPELLKEKNKFKE